MRKLINELFKKTSLELYRDLGCPSLPDIEGCKPVYDTEYGIVIWFNGMKFSLKEWNIITEVIEANEHKIYIKPEGNRSEQITHGRDRYLQEMG